MIALKTILIIEDDRAINNLIKGTLSAEGYVCDCAFDGREGANLLEEKRYDLVLLDLMLPEIGGYELLEYIHPMGIPAIVISAMGRVEDRIRGLRMGADDYLCKPFQIGELLARVESVLRRTGAPAQKLQIGDVTIDPEFYKPDINDYPELRAALANGGSVTLSEDVTIEAPLVVETGKTVEIDLNGKDIINTTSLPDTDPRYGNTTVFEVKGGATLNIKGDGNIKAIGTKPNEDGYRMAVYAYGDAKVNIYGGNFVNDQDYNDHNAQLDLIYADQQAVINIYGGTFESKSANNRGYWVLNLKDGSGAAINVYGGTFINYDPSSSMTENPVKNFVAEGYTAIKTSAEPAPNGTYTVVKGTEVAAPADLESALKSGDIAIVSRSMTIDDSPYISSVASATLSLKEGAVLTAQEGSELQQCIQVSKSCKKMVISGKGFIVGPKNSTATNVAGIYSGCPDLVIDGTITVDGSSGSKGTNAAIRIAEGTTTIKDGYFTVGTDASGIANSCILVATARPSQKAHLKIYGGVFETKGNPINGWYPVINIQDADRKAGRATVEIYGGIFINYNPATGDNTGEADDTFVAPGYKSVETTYNGQQAWQVIPE